jgi:hypothetical protein
MSDTLLDKRSQSIIAEKHDAQIKMQALQGQRNFVAEIDRFINKTDVFEKQADIHLGKFPNVERAYVAITDKIAAYVNRQRQLSGNANAGVARNQLTVAANQASLQTDQIHNSVEQFQWSFDADTKALIGESLNAGQQCRSVSQLTVFTPNEIQNINAACSRFEDADPNFRKEAKALADGLFHLEQVYQKERNAQQRLLEESNKLD